MPAGTAAGWPQRSGSTRWASWSISFDPKRDDRNVRPKVDGSNAGPQFIEGKITRAELDAQGLEYAKSVTRRSSAEGAVVRNDFDDARLARRSLS